jgi:hypothetical protein
MAYSFLGGKFREIDSTTGLPLSGGLLYTYAAGTLTPLATFTDAGGGSSNTNPVVLDSAGRADVFLGNSTYRMILKSALGVTVWDEDNITSTGAVLATLASTSSAAAGPALVGLNPTLNYVAGTIGAHIVDDAWDPRDYPWLAKFDGTTDDTAAVNACLTAARSGSKCVQFPAGKTCKVSASLNFSGLHVIGLGGLNQIHIQATSAQFDVITTTGSTLITGLFVHGGWDGTTAGQTGNTISINNGPAGFPYFVHLRDCVILNSKSRGIYIQNGGYTSLFNVKVNACGLHGIDLFGNSAIVACTTISIGGQSIFSDTPNGYGANLTECISVNFHTVIMENTKGIQISGADNRSLCFDTVYQENTIGGNFITPGTSGGGGLSVVNCFGGGAIIPYPTNWQDVFYRGNSVLAESAIPFVSRILTADGGQLTTAVTGGVSVTATSLALPPGTWQVYGVVQTLNSAGATFVKAGATITTNVADTGLDNSTSTPIFGADQAGYTPGGATADVRLQPFDIIQNTTTANVTCYLRAFFNIGAGTLAYRGLIKAVKLS